MNCYKPAGLAIPMCFFISFCIFAASTTAQTTAFKYRQQKQVTVTHGAVVSAHPLASEAGLKMLKAGGNAFDAAIAVQYALAVVYPGAGNLGGGGFLVAHTASGKNIAIDYRETAPEKASRDMYLDSAGNPLTDLSLEDHFASGVPGTVAGLFSSHKYAKLPMRTLIQPAIELAEKGFALTAAQAADFNASRETFTRLNPQGLAFVRKKEWKAGDILKQPELAATLRRIEAGGQKGFYEGRTALLLEADMKRKGGIISLADLKNYRAAERTAMAFNYRNHEVISMPLPSSGGIILQQLLTMMRIGKLSAYPFHSFNAVQLMVEASRRAFADRAEYLGDADYVKVPVKQLTDETYLRQRLVDFEKGKAGNSKVLEAGAVKESEETTHLSVVDAAGNAVSVTTTLNDHFGNKTVIAGAGFLMNNEMDDFSVKPGVPNMYGAIGNDKNAIAAGKRMLSSMTPTIVLKNKKPFIIVGTPGGTTIPTSVFQTIVNLIDFNLSPADAVNRPKFHHQWLPDEVFVEEKISMSLRAELTAAGYKVTQRANIGRTELIVIKNGMITAVADSRGDDDARGY